MLLSELIQGFGAKLTQKPIVSLMAPAFLAWAIGSGAWAERAWNWFVGLHNDTEKLGVIVGFLLGVATSAFLVQRLDFFVLRLLEGYWPACGCVQWLRRLWVRKVNHRIDRMNARFQMLAQKGIGNLSPKEVQEYVGLDRRLMRIPNSPALRMPTRLGNTLRAAELRPRDKYGLETVVCWPRLWLLLPIKAKEDMNEARASLDTAAYIATWGALLVLWGAGASVVVWCVSEGRVPSVLIFAPATIGLLTFFFAYRAMIGAAEVYGDLVESSFDVHRLALYRSLRWPLPANPAEERQRGEELTNYLWRGSDQQCPIFVALATNEHGDFQDEIH